MAGLMDTVGELLREAAEDIVLPLFGRREAAAQEKAPGEWVTAADRAAEAFLAAALTRQLPGSLVVGEEAASADPGVLRRLESAGAVWLLDPLDGTANFAAGVPPFSIMAALVRDGETVASWMLDPVSGRLARAQRGGGAWLDGQKVMTPAAVPPLAELAGVALRRFLPGALAAHVESAGSRFSRLAAGSGCAGEDYQRIAAGVMDFALYWRTLPWDHAPGLLFVTEAGGAAARLDGAEYRPARHERPGLLVARNQAVWHSAAEALIPG